MSKPAVAASNADYEIKVIGDRPAPLRDFYHRLLTLSWAGTLSIIAGVFIAANLVFAAGYLVTGGIANASGSFLNAFFFSVQTMGTIGYGAVYPASRAANFLVVVESIVGLILTAMATGIVFAKISRSTARVRFTRQATISPMNGVPTLSIRIGNERGNRIVDVQLRAVLMRSERTTEGKMFYRTVDLKLSRERALTLSRSFTLLHTIDPGSPLHGVTPEQADALEVEMHVLVVGLDDTTMQTVHAGQQYFTKDIRWGARHVDVLSEDGPNLLLDLRKFHDIEPSEPTADFPYPVKASDRP